MPPHLDHVHEVRDFKSFTSVFDQFSENSNSFKLRVLTGLHGAEQTMNSDELLCRALSLGHHLLSIGIRAGDRIAIIAPSSPLTVVAMLACWSAGAAFSLISPGKTVIERSHKEIALKLLSPAAIIVQNADSARELGSFSCDKVVQLTTIPLLSIAGDYIPHRASPTDVAFIQFTSGSTGAPRGVPVTHNQLSSSCICISERAQITEADCMVLWSPLYHDMGLMALLISLWNRIGVRLIPTETFMRRPTVWLDEISDGGTLTTAPPSMYYLLSRRVNEDQAGRFDLSSLRYAWIGAEPVFVEQITSFVSRFTSAGLMENVLQPCYGLAEAVVLVTARPPQNPPLELQFDRDQLRAGKIVPLDLPGKNSVRLLGNGPPLTDVELQIVGNDDNEVPSGTVGRIRVRGRLVTTGYIGEPPKSSDEWRATGDLGFMMNGELFVAGREKETIKRNGATISPHDLEWVAERHLNLRTGRAAAFSLIDHELARERIILLVEAPPGQMTREVNRSLGSAILNSTGIQVDQIIFVGLNGIPRTTSGKLRRDAARSRFVMT